MKKHKIDTHNPSKHSIKEEKCEICQYAAKDVEDLKKHKAETHIPNSSSETDRSEGNFTTCNQCDFSSDSASDLNNHNMTEHEDDGHFQLNYKCGRCDFAANLRKLLKNHMKEKHTQMTIYLCEICKFEASTTTDYQNHMEDIHSQKKRKAKDNKDFECDQCSEKFVTFDHLWQHKEEAHILVNYMCTKCDYQTNVKENLNVHMKSVHTVEDRKSGYTKPKLYSRKEKQENGFCRLWNSGYCRMGDVCKFLHKECPKCYYQEQCKWIARKTRK